MTLEQARARSRVVVEEHPDLDLARFQAFAELYGRNLSHAASTARALGFAKAHPAMDLERLADLHEAFFSTIGLDLSHVDALDEAVGVLAEQPEFSVARFAALARFLRSPRGLSMGRVAAGQRALAVLREAPDADPAKVSLRSAALALELAPLDPGAQAHVATERALRELLPPRSPTSSGTAPSTVRGKR